MKNFMKGFLLASIGVTMLNVACDVISTCGELLKAMISSKIVSYNNAIEEAIKTDSSTRAIGFQIEEDGDNDEN